MFSTEESTLLPTGNESMKFDNDSAWEVFGFGLESDPFVVRINGIVSPVIVLYTVVINCFMCLVLMKPHMRSPTNALLVAIAVTDVITGLCPLPCYLFFYSIGNCFDWVPFDWCAIYFCLTDYLPTIFHTASIWLTVILAFQRYVCICHLHKGRRWFSLPRVFLAVLLVYVTATMTHVIRFFERDFEPFNVTSKLDANVTVTSCHHDLRPFFVTHAQICFNVYYWFRVVFINLVPCASLLILNILLILTLRTAQKRKVRLLGRQKSDSSGSQRPSEGNSTTLMLVFVVGLFLLVELPLAALFIVLIIQNTFEVRLLSDEDMDIATHVVNLAILFSYPINFFIYCAMSRKFRETFVAMFLGFRGRHDPAQNTQYYSLATDGEALNTVQPDVVAQTGC